MISKRILCISDAMDDMQNFTTDHIVKFFAIEQINPTDHSLAYFENLYSKLKIEVDLGSMDLVIAEYVESLIVVNLMRLEGYIFPAIFIPHTNPYPVDIFSYFLLNRLIGHVNDLVLCGSKNSADAYRRLLDIDSKSICTFGIKDKHSVKFNKISARNYFGLAQNEDLLLYTGRFMDDKGINELSDAIEIIQAERPSVRLIISVTHLAPSYYNRIASKLQNTILFYRLSREDLIQLYNAVDLYVCCATSIYETYGKSQLEAIAAGVPTIVPNWDGFPHYINNTNGLLAKVNYSDDSFQSPFDFCKVDIEDFSKKCLIALDNLTQFSPKIEPWALYSHTVKRIQIEVNKILDKSNNIPASVEFMHKKTPNLTICAKLFLNEYGLTYDSISLEKLSCMGIINRENIGSKKLRRYLHHSIFNPGLLGTD